MGKDLNIKERTKGNNLSYNGESFKGRIRNDFDIFVGERNVFVNSVASSWNNLPQNVINSLSQNSFKAALDKFTRNGHSVGRLPFLCWTLGIRAFPDARLG